MTESEYKDKLLKFHHKIMALPATDMKYHLYLLLVSLNTDNTEYTRNILECALEFTDCMYDFFHKENMDDQLFFQIHYLYKSFDDLINVAGTNTEMLITTDAIQNLGGSIVGFATGIVGGFVGGISGITRGIWNQERLWEYSWTGVFVGAFLGAAIGFRSPPKLLRDPLFQQVKYALDGVSETFERMQNDKDITLDSYLEKAYEILLKDYFDNDKTSLDDYMDKERVEYEIGTWGAEFVSPILAGSVGHHAFIRVPINGKYHGMEFTPSPSDFTIPPIQSEKRYISGKKILEMAAFHLCLQKTDAFTAQFFVTKLKPGERDCFSYVNKLLTGTSQDPTCLTRYHPSDKAAGHAVRFFIENLAIFPSNLHLQLEERNSEETNNGGEGCSVSRI